MLSPAPAQMHTCLTPALTPEHTARAPSSPLPSARPPSTLLSLQILTFQVLLSGLGLARALRCPCHDHHTPCPSLPPGPAREQ